MSRRSSLYTSCILLLSVLMVSGVDDDFSYTVQYILVYSEPWHANTLSARLPYRIDTCNKQKFCAAYSVTTKCRSDMVVFPHSLYVVMVILQFKVIYSTTVADTH